MLSCVFGVVIPVVLSHLPFISIWFVVCSDAGDSTVRQLTPHFTVLRYTEQFCLLINGGIFSLHFWQQCLLFICFVFAFYDVSSLACFSVAVS